MPKDNSSAYSKIDSFIAGLSPDERRYLYGAIESIIEGEDNGETEMPENDMEMAAEKSAPTPMGSEDDDMMSQSDTITIPKDDDTTDYDELFS